MNINKNLLLSLVLLMGFGPLQTLSQPIKAHANAGVPTATWLWNTSTIAAQGNEILSFAGNNQVKQIYLQVNKSIPFDTYKTFIQKATEKGIEIHALDGSPQWVSSKGSAYSKEFFNWVGNYQKSASQTQRFTGIHLDIEPYLYSGWNSKFKNTVLAYQNIINHAAVTSEQLGLTFGIDIPFWFDEIAYSNTYGKGNLANWAIKTTSFTTIMAYRDQAAGGNGIIELVRNEVQYASSLGKPIVIGVETGKSEEANLVSFYEEGAAHMYSQLSLVKSAYPQPDVTFAIHHLHSWMIMAP